LLEASLRQRNRIEEIAADFDQDRENAFKLLRQEHRELMVTYAPYIIYVQGAQTSRVPWSLVPGIEDLSRLLHPGQKLLTTCLEEPNYRIQWNRLPDLINGIDALDEPTSVSIDDFDLLMIPSTQRLNAFLHVLVGHELFHPLLNGFLDHQQAQISDRIRVACEAILPQDERFDRYVSYTLNLWRRAMEELVCDFGCAHVFGPSALLAYVAFSLCSDIDALPIQDPFYPPSRYRIRLVFEHAFGEEGHSNHLKSLLGILSASSEFTVVFAAFHEFWKEIEEITRDDSDLKAIAMPSNGLIAIAYPEIAACIRPAWEFVTGIPGLDSRSWISCLAEIPYHLHKLKMDVPCGEFSPVGQPVGVTSTPSAVFLAAWLYELHNQRILGEAAEAGDRYHRACRLLLKYLEDIEVKRTFKDKIAPEIENPS
jgi:hypothetical protein